MKKEKNIEKSSDQREVQFCDLLILNAYILTLDEKRRIIANGAIAVKGNTIIAVGPEQEIVPQFRPLRILNANGAPVHPGFIDAHYHPSIHLARGLISDDPKAAKAVTLNDWFSVIGDDDEYVSSLATCIEMIQHGYTSFMEPGTAFETDTVAASAEAIGIRVSLADTLLYDIERNDAIPPAILKRVPSCEKGRYKLLGTELWRNKNPNSLIRGHISVYGLGTASKELMLAAKACADENHVVFDQHYNFTLEEAERNDNYFGGRHSLVCMAEMGLLDKNCTFSHMNVIREDEVRPIADSGMSVVWNPGNYQFYSIALKVRTRMPELLKEGVNISFGVDAAKVWTFSEMEFIGYLIARHFGDYISPEELLEMRTIGGAKALGLDNIIGSIEPGKRADLVIRNNHLSEAQPGVNIVQELMLISRSHSIETVIVDGKIVFKNGHSTQVDEEYVYALARATTKRIMGKLGFVLETKWPIVT